MNPVLTAVLVVAGLALLAGLVLAVASVVLAVPRDEKAEALRELLPGANCGACGYSGCDGYAQAMAHEGAKAGLCSPGGEEVAAATAALLGVSASLQRRTALVHCGGCEEAAAHKLTYRGLPSCAAANAFYGGDLACSYGCLGYGDCVRVCEYDAITVENGLARVDGVKCRACGLCVKTCPKGILSLAPADAGGVVRCSSHDKGAQVRKVCTAGCIGCGKCQKVCPVGAARVEGFLASIDPEACTGCGACAAACPAGCISMLGGKSGETGF